MSSPLSAPWQSPLTTLSASAGTSSFRRPATPIWVTAGCPTACTSPHPRTRGEVGRNAEDTKQRDTLQPLVDGTSQGREQTIVQDRLLSWPTLSVQVG